MGRQVSPSLQDVGNVAFSEQGTRTISSDPEGRGKRSVGLTPRERDELAIPIQRRARWDSPFTPSLWAMRQKTDILPKNANDFGAKRMQIREATRGDYAELTALYARMCELLGEEDFLPEGNKGGFPSGSMIMHAIEQHEQFVGIEDGTIAAAYIIDHECDPAYDQVDWTVDAARDEVSILHALRVLPEFGGRGFAKQLVDHAIKTAKERGQRAIRLDCIEGNDIPQNMYRSFGFQYVETVSITYPDIGVPRDFLVYELAL